MSAVELPALQGTHVRYPNMPRCADVVSDGKTFVFTLPDDWVSADDIQAMVDFVDAERLQVKEMLVCHALRRALIQCGVLTLDNPFTISTEIKADKDVPPRIIRMVT